MDGDLGGGAGVVEFWEDIRGDRDGGIGLGWGRIPRAIRGRFLDPAILMSSMLSIRSGGDIVV